MTSLILTLLYLNCKTPYFDYYTPIFMLSHIIISLPYTSYNTNVELRCRLVLYLICSYNKPLTTLFIDFLFSSHLHVLLREKTLSTKCIHIVKTMLDCYPYHIALWSFIRFIQLSVSKNIYGFGGGIRTHDVQIMSLTSYQTALLRDIEIGISPNPRKEVILNFLRERRNNDGLILFHQLYYVICSSYFSPTLIYFFTLL